MNNFFQYFVFLNAASGVPGALYFLFGKNKAGSVRQLIFLILLASLCADVIAIVYIRFVYPNSYIISNPWYLVNYFLISILYLSFIPEFKKLIYGLLAAFAIGSIISFGFYTTFFESNTFIRAWTSVSFVILSLLTYYQILKNEPVDDITVYPVFWVNTGIFLYSALNILRTTFENYLVFDLQVSSDAYNYIGSINLFFNIVKNIMLFYSLILIHRGHPTALARK